ncbi:hypothetical protein [Allorhodopirellula heiligendammensis]|uniref:Uncharacterized protein n=1 Tax=Allorhodopirellula heiligendammensis TaxID=2714739 RepID=A0A5C6BKN7_9BACT|nr:hypothetical protein [Allorhodopirellula heiligendammensis]TWU11014.1 hypothetical protein Poly21_49210 [Allorhodopirellula heiligendammensis]
MLRLPGSRVTWLLVSLVGVAAGCARKEYDLRLVPDGGSMQRTLTVTAKPSSEGSDHSSLSDAELAHMREFYQPALEQIQDGSHTFVGTFHGEMPADVGGAGEYVCLASPLGSASLYVERFRGEDDLQQSERDRHAAIDQSVDLLLNWAHEEFAGQAILARLERLIDQDIRRDLKNVSGYCWAYGMVFDMGGELGGQRLMARVGQYLVERNYFSLADLPNMVAVFQSEDQAAMAGLLRDTVIRKLQVEGDEPAVASLAIFGNAKELGASLRASIRRTEFYQSELTKYKSTHNLDDGTEVSDRDFDPLGLLVEGAFQAMLPTAFRNASVSVTLQSKVEPFATNGSWDTGAAAVQWSSPIADSDIPAVFFAAWSEPDHDAQQRHFGETILTGEPLAQFALWYRGLADPHRQQYAEFLRTLTPGRTLVEKINAFTFVGDDQPVELPRSLLTEAIDRAR